MHYELTEIKVIYCDDIDDVTFAVGPIISELESYKVDVVPVSDLLCKKALIFTSAPRTEIVKAIKKVLSDQHAYPWIVDAYF